MNLPLNFYKLVEEPGFLKHIPYGDSVGKDSRIVFKINNEIDIDSIENFWILLSNIYDIDVIDDHEYIFCDNKIEILNYDIKNDRIIYCSPKYLMRHFYNGNICKNNLNNNDSILTTYNHSFVSIDSYNKVYKKETPLNIKYIPTLINNEINITEISFTYLLLGLYYGDGNFYSYYPKISFNNAKKSELFLNKYFPNSKLKIYHQRNNLNDCHINHKELRNILIENNLEKIKSINRIITSKLFTIFKDNFECFFSFLLGYWIADGTLTSEKIFINSGNKKLLEQVQDLLHIHKIFSTINTDINGRKYNEKIFGDMFKLNIRGVNNNLFSYFKEFSEMKNINSEFRLSNIKYGTSNNYKNNGILKKTDGHNVSFLNIQPCKIKNKEDIEYSNYVYDLEVPNTHIFIINGCIVHNTDSIFITIPTKKKYDISERWDFAETHAKNINSIIVDKYKELVKLQNINEKEITASFKTELIMSDLFFLDKKKSYAVKQENKEGVIIDPPKIKYTGIEIIKKNSAKFTQDLLKDMIENCILNSDILIEDKLTELTNIITNHFDKFKKDIYEYNFNNISKPCKWNKTKNIIESMKIYNHILEKEVFNYGSAGRYIYVTFQDLKLFKDLKDVDFKKTDMMSIPLKYDSELLKEKMEKFKISINSDKQYDTIFNLSCKSIIRVIKTIIEKQKKGR